MRDGSSQTRVRYGAGMLMVRFRRELMPPPKAIQASRNVSGTVLMGKTYTGHAGKPALSDPAERDRRQGYTGVVRRHPDRNPAVSTSNGQCDLRPFPERHPARAAGHLHV